MMLIVGDMERVVMAGPIYLSNTKTESKRI